jgi:hypothetical protein
MIARNTYNTKECEEGSGRFSGTRIDYLFLASELLGELTRPRTYFLWNRHLACSRQAFLELSNYRSPLIASYL